MDVYKASILSTVLTFAILGVLCLAAESALSAAVAAGVLVSLPPLLEYGPTCWEHIPQALCVTLGAVILLKRGRLPEEIRLPAGTLLLLAAFVLRPDSAPLLLIPAWMALRTARRATFLLVCGAAALTIAAYFFTHRALYGGFFPNTYYLKVRPGIESVEAGIRYFFVSWGYGATPGILLALLLLGAERRLGWTQEERIVLAAFALQCLYIVFVGGDVFPAGRFFLLMFPLATLLLAEKLELCLDAERLRPLALAAAALFAITLAVNLVKQQRAFDDKALAGINSGLPSLPAIRPAILATFPAISEHLSPGDGSIGMFYLGLGYYLPDFRMADFLGKADPVIAHEPAKWGPVGHNKWDIDHTLGTQNVAVIPIARVDADAADRMLEHRDAFAFYADLELNPYLHEHYTYLSPTELHSPCDIGMWVRNDLVGRFR